MEQIATFDFLRLHSDKDGAVENAAERDAVVAAATSGNYTDVIFIGHGFRNDEADAGNLYMKFLHGFETHRARSEFAPALGNRKWLTVGVFWPSKKFSEGEESNDGSVQSVGDDLAASANTDTVAARAQLTEYLADLGADEATSSSIRSAFEALAATPNYLELQDAFVQALLNAVTFTDSDGTEGLDRVRSKRGSELLQSLSTPIILPTVQRGEGGVMSVGDMGGSGSGNGGVLMIGGFFKSVMGRVGQVLNLGTWYTMKARAGDVGMHTVADVVRRITAGSGTHPRIHLVGHSLGGRMMAAAARALAAAPVQPVASLTLLEAAFSHYGFSDNVPSNNTPGFFRDVVSTAVVSGPMISTFSYQDTVVGKAYAVSSRLAGDNAKAIGDKDDQYGGLGRNGAQKTAEVTAHLLHEVGAPYAFVKRTINNVDGSGGGITEHGDVTNDRVTYAFTSAVSQT